jgi:hypothetical protein
MSQPGYHPGEKSTFWGIRYDRGVLVLGQRAAYSDLI